MLELKVCTITPSWFFPVLLGVGVLLCSPRWPQTLGPHVSASLILGLQACVTVAGEMSLLLKSLVISHLPIGDILGLAVSVSCHLCGSQWPLQLVYRVLRVSLSASVGQFRSFWCLDVYAFVSLSSDLSLISQTNQRAHQNPSPAEITSFKPVVILRGHENQRPAAGEK